MTTPLMIGESVPLEVRNILKSLEVGMPIRWKGNEGTIEFVDDEYITMCFRAYPNDDPNAVKNVHKCCLIIYPHQWDEIEIEDTHFYDVKNYKGKTDDHPGNDMLPSIDQR